MLTPLLLLLLPVQALAPLLPSAPLSGAPASVAVPMASPSWSGRWVSAGGELASCPGWRLTLGPGLVAGLSGPRPAPARAPWQAVAETSDRRCLVRTEAADAQAVYVRVRIEAHRGAADAVLVRWDVATGRWTDAMPDPS